MNKYLSERRLKLFNQLDNNSISLNYSFRVCDEPLVNDKYDVDRNTYYLTGLFNYGHILLISKINNEYKEVLFIAPYDIEKAKWETLLKIDEAKEISGISDIRYLNEFDSYMDSINDSIEKIYLDLSDEEVKAKKGELFLKAIYFKNKYQKPSKSSRKIFKDLRFIKDEGEIAELYKGIEATKYGIMNMLNNLKPMYEYQLESYFDQGIKFNGANGYSFPSIFASGINSCCLHYSDNDSQAQNGDLLLIDVGGSHNMYCGDISRTFPINGTFTKRQKLIYNIVLEAQHVAYSKMKPGVTLKELNQAVIDFYAVKLKEIGLIEKPEDVRKYYYHSVSHHIGLNCHDDVDYSRPLEAGNVISNEPGLYITEEKIGIRIEDDMLITNDGAIWMSKDIIKDPDEIEKYLGGHKDA